VIGGTDLSTEQGAHWTRSGDFWLLNLSCHHERACLSATRDLLLLCGVKNAGGVTEASPARKGRVAHPSARHQHFSPCTIEARVGAELFLWFVQNRFGFSPALDVQRQVFSQASNSSMTSDVRNRQ
jgi:hypothetical protein